MLSDRERETLREVQRQFLAEDPGLARSFDDVGQQDPLQWLAAVPRWAYTATFVAMVLLGILMITARAPGVALALAALATLVSLARRQRDHDVAEQR